MSYIVKFPSASSEKKFEKELIKIKNPKVQDEIMAAVGGLSKQPRPFGKKQFIKIKPPIYFYEFVAQYRLRIGKYRILYDIDDRKRIVWILALRKRSERTYK